MNLHAAAAYARHLLTARSTAGHGVHSPFMFSFITEVIGGKSDRAIMKEVESLRREMLADRRVVRVRDLGAGSVVIRGGDRGTSQAATVNGIQRSIRQIAAAAAVPKREAAMLARIAGSIGKLRNGDQCGSQTPVAGPDYDDRPVILELGTSLGIGTLALALGAPEEKVISVEGCPGLAEIARNNLVRHGAHNAEVICMEFSEALHMLRTRNTKVALAFIDGNHRGAALTEYVHSLREMGDEIIIVADDIHMNRDMIQAWRTLPGEGIAPASVETLRAGILFCRRNLTPGRYRVR